MKRNLLYLLMLVGIMSVFTACDDDKDEPNIPIETQVAGTYKGNLDVSIDGTQMPGNGLPNTIIISKANVSAINLELKNFSFMGQNFGDITIANCDMLKYRDHYSIAGEETVTLPEPIGKCPVVVSGTMMGREVNLNLDITVPALNQTVRVKFDGTKLNGNESSEAKITNFVFDSELITLQPVIDENTKTITFKVSDEATSEALQELVPTFGISSKALVSPASGIKQNFNNPVVYTVVAEDGTTKVYTVSMSGSQSVMKFSFEEWKTVAGSFLTNEYVTPLPEDVLATSAPGAAFLKLFQIKDLPVFKSDDKKEGKFAIKLVTMDTSAKVSTLVPAITSGSVFTGKFDLDVEDRIGSTKFGISYDKQPVRFEGWYKYAPGKKFIDGSKATKPSEIVEKPDMVDQCAVQAVLYEAVGTDGKEVILTGHDINSSDYRVAVAELKDGTAKVEYTYFNIPFVYLAGKEYSADKKYKLAIVCSSSKEGDFFKGAGGSTLILDELEVIGE